MPLKPRMVSQHRDTTLRQWTTLRMIPREPHQLTTRAIWERLTSEGYVVNLRTVQRDLDTLSAQFGFSSDSRKGPEGAVWFWPQLSATLDIPGLEPSTAIALLLSREHLAPILPKSTLGELAPYFARAEAVLKEQHSNALSSWHRKVRVLHRGPRLATPPIAPAVQQNVYEGLLRSRQIEAQYRSRGSTTAKPLNLSPLGLVVKDGITYLVATSWDYADVRHYALHRFEDVTLLEAPSKAAKDFDLDRYIEEEKTFSYRESPNNLRLRLEVVPNVAVHLSERPLSTDQRITESADGRSRISATVADTAELRWWLLGFGSQIEVLGPKALRDEFAEISRATSKLYTTEKA